MYQANYRSILDFSNNALIASEKGFNKMMEAFKMLSEISISDECDFDPSAWKQSCYDAMNDDFNSPILIANLFEAVKYVNLLIEKKETLTAEDLENFKTTINAFVFDVLGLKNDMQEDSSDKLSGVVELLISMRKEARDNKDWALSDKIRDELSVLGIQLKDGKEGTTFSVN